MNSLLATLAVTPGGGGKMTTDEMGVLLFCLFLLLVIGRSKAKA